MKKALLKKGIVWGVMLLAVFAFLGCPADTNDDPKNDPPDDPNTVQPLTLSVSDIPEGITILAATLFKNSMAKTDLVATGALVNGTFTFSVPDPETGWPTGTPYGELGEHYILLATSMSGTNNYIYVGGGSAPAKFNFDTAAKTIVWNGNFVSDGTGGSDPENDLVLTVTGAPATSVMVALLADMTGLMTLATGDFSVLSASGTIGEGGTFVIESMNNDFDPFDPKGYYLLLVGQSAMMNPESPSFDDSYIYIQLQGQQPMPAPYQFTEGEDNTIAFVEATPSPAGVPTFLSMAALMAMWAQMGGQ